MNAFRLWMALAAAAIAPAAARANLGPAAAALRHSATAAVVLVGDTGEVAARRGAKHASHPRKSPHRSAPRHRTVVKHTAKPRTVHRTAVRHTTRAFRPRTTTVNRSTTVFASRGYARRGHSRTSRYSVRHSYTAGRYAHRSSRYSRRHVRRRTQSTQSVVQGIVDSTSGAAGNGAVQVKLVPASTNRFQYGVAVNAPNNAKIRNYSVNNNTRYMQVTNARGGMKASSFKQLAPGQPVLIMAPRGNNAAAGNLFAQAIEIFPLK
jgi:hypothetical protein